MTTNSSTLHPSEFIGKLNVTIDLIVFSLQVFYGPLRKVIMFPAGMLPNGFLHC